jgi:hypothetical protein
LSQHTPVPDPAPEPDPASEPAPEPASDPAPEPGTGPLVAEPAASEAGPLAAEAAPPSESAGEPWSVLEPAAGAPAHRPRKRGRTTLLIAAAAVLGVLAGGGLGYRIQQQRTPTPLPPLTGSAPVQPKGAGPAVAVLPASQDRAAVFDGDLLKMVVPAPKGAKDAERSWLSMADVAEGWDDPAAEFENLAGDDWRRAVEADWLVGDDRYCEIDISQFRDDSSPVAPRLFTDWQSGIDYDTAYGPGQALTGVTNGYVWPSRNPHRRAGYLPEYQGRGLAEVGNLLIEVFVDAPHPVRASTVKALIEQQLERL